MASNNGYVRKWESRRAGRSVADEARDSYYGLPVVKAPHWDWKIVLYFFLGGISSMSYVIACVAGMVGGRTNEKIERVGRYLSLVTLIPSPLLLILDLGRPERFHHMLRVVKLRSPMSVGTWGLSFYGMFCAASALVRAAQDGLFDWFPLARRVLLALPRAPLNMLGAFFGFFVAGYTGVLLGITAIPLWAKTRLLLGPLFLSSALASGTSAIALILGLLPGDQHKALKRVERLDMLARLAELALLLAVRSKLGSVLGKPLREGKLARLFRFGVLGVGIIVPSALQVRSLFGSKPSRAVTLVASLCTLVGGYCLRHLIVYAGLASARDPHATFEYTRRG